MNGEPRYNDIFYRMTTSHSRIMDVVGDNISLQDIPVPIDWTYLFKNPQPVEIEVGTGKGRFLFEASKQHPHVNFLGVERAQKYVHITRERFRKYLRHYEIGEDVGLFNNVRFVWTDANFFITRYVPDESVQAYHIYFPDPWPKVRQQKRRIFRNKEFLSGIARTLYSDGGKLYIATDFAEYFDEIQERIDMFTRLKTVSHDISNYEEITTNFETKYLREGREIYRVVYEKP